MIANLQTPAHAALLKLIEAQIEDQNGNADKVQGLSLKNRKLGRIVLLDRLPMLKIVDLSNNSITSMQGLQTCLHLTQLYLSQNNIPKITHHIQYLPMLRILDLRGNAIIDLNQSFHCMPNSLTSLKVGWNFITNVRDIVKLDTCKIEVLWLSDNLFVKGQKQYYKRVLRGRGMRVTDLWI